MTGRNALVVATLATVALAPATSAVAAPSTCDAYSHSCTKVEGKKITKQPPAVLGTSTSLPFTGAEIVLMTVVGGGALGAGAMFVVAGRRRKASQPAA